MAVIAIALAIVIAAPRYADPVVADAGDASLLDEAPAAPGEEVLEVRTTPLELPSSKPPSKLKGYRWPVRGGTIARYYETHGKGDFEIDGERVHDGLIITWFEGAWVKAAHRGEVVAVGRDWVKNVGFMGDLEAVYEHYAPMGDPKKARKSGKPPFPQGIVIDDGNGYYSVYTEIDELQVKVGDRVKVGQPIGRMAVHEGMQMMRYRLVRVEGLPMKVHKAARARGYPHYAAERVDPLAVLKTNVKRMPVMKRKPPKDPPRLSEY